MFKKILSTFFTRFFISLSSLIIAVLLSNYLGASGRGEQSLIITLITFIIIISSVIGASAISYLIPRFPFMTLILPSYAWVILFMVICYLLLPLLNLVPAVYTTDVCILSFFLALLNINISVLISKQRINAANLLGFLQSFVIIMALLVSFLLLDEKSIHSYIIALYAGYGSAMLLSFVLIGGYFKRLHLEPLALFMAALKKLVVLGFYNQLALFAQLLSFRLGYYILDAHFGKESVGIYSNAVSVAESIWLIGRSIGIVQHSKIVNSKDLNFSVSFTSRMNKINLLISFLLIIILALIPSSWYTWIFGEEFTNINRIIWTLAPGILFFGIVVVLGYYFSSTGKHIVNALASIAGLIMTIILGFSIIPAWHSYGAGITASISYGVTALVVIIFFRREKKIHIHKKK